MYKIYKWTCNQCFSIQEMVHYCTEAEHNMERNGQSAPPPLQCGNCKAFTQFQVQAPTIDPILLEMSNETVGFGQPVNPQLTTSGPSSVTSSPLVQRSGRKARQRLATPCKRQAARHHPYQHPTSAPASQKEKGKGKGKAKAKIDDKISMPPPSRPVRKLAPAPPPSRPIPKPAPAPPPAPPPAPAPPPPPPIPETELEILSNPPAPPSLPTDVVEKMHVNRTKIFKSAAGDLMEAKAKLGDKAPQIVCNAWEGAWNQLKKDMGIAF